jgi:uncharacterized cupin superfamily protein
MSDITLKQIDELDSYQSPDGKNNNQFFYAGKGLGVTAFGMNVLKLPPNWLDYPDHDHASGFQDGQEEVYVVLEGSAMLQADNQTWELVPGTLVRVGPSQKRKIIPGAKGVTILALGGVPGKPYTA